MSFTFDYWQARFNVLADAWRDGNNDTVLKATRDFLKANDDAPAELKLEETAALRAELLKKEKELALALSSAKTMKDSWDAACHEISKLHEEHDQLKSCQESLRSALSDMIELYDCDGNDSFLSSSGPEIRNKAVAALRSPQPLSESRDGT